MGKEFPERLTNARRGGSRTSSEVGEGRMFRFGFFGEGTGGVEKDRLSDREGLIFVYFIHFERL